MSGQGIGYVYIVYMASKNYVYLLCLILIPFSRMHLVS